MTYYVVCLECGYKLLKAGGLYDRNLLPEMQGQNAYRG